MLVPVALYNAVTDIPLKHASGLAISEDRGTQIRRCTMKNVNDLLRHIII
jgi:hypothetical protein